MTRRQGSFTYGFISGFVVACFFVLAVVFYGGCSQTIVVGEGTSSKSKETSILSPDKIEHKKPEFKKLKHLIDRKENNE